MKCKISTVVGLCCLCLSTLILTLITYPTKISKESHLSFSKPMRPEELLTIQSLLHVPECAQDKHCRSACRMVCQEVTENIGEEADHASSLVAFGCCFNSPIIDKQVTGTSFGVETELSQVWNNPNSRKLLGLELHDKHSLRADYNELKKHEDALKKRLSVLSIQNSLGFKSNPVKHAQSLMDSEFNGWNEGLTDGEYGWDSKSWGFHHDASQRGWFANNTKGRHIDDANDPFGTEWHFFAHDGKAAWKNRRCTGDGCPGSSDGMRNLQRYAAHLAAATSLGVSADFVNESQADALALPGWDDPPGSAAYDARQQESLVPGLGEPAEDFAFNASATPPDVDADDALPGPSRRHAALWGFEPPETSYRLCRRNASADDCDAQLRAWHDAWEWRPRPCPNATAAAAAAPAAAGCGHELVSRRLEEESGYAAARGLADPADIEDGLLDPVLSNETARAFLGPDLYDEYLREGAGPGADRPARWDGSSGLAHRTLARGILGAAARRHFREAYGKSEWEWCLAQHRRDRDFPRACTRPGTAGATAARPYQARHRPRTAPEEVLGGVEAAFSDLIGADRVEGVAGPAGPELLHPHPNRFEFGATAVPEGRTRGAGPAWWERIKGVRDVPQTMEGRAAQARDRRRLPGVRVESWNGWPTLHRALGPGLAMSSGQCCSTFMHMSDEE